MNFPALKFDNSNNAAMSLSIISEHVRRGNIRVTGHEIDSTGKLRLTVDLPGSKTIRQERPVR